MKIIKTGTRIRSALSYLFTLGVNPKFAHSYNRITIFTNVIAIFGGFSLFGIYSQVRASGIPFNESIYLLLISGLAFMMPVLNRFNKSLLARWIGQFILLSIGVCASIFFGKTFNGHYIFFVAIIYSIVAFSSSPKWQRVLVIGLTLPSLPIADYLYHSGILPVTGFESKSYPVSVLIYDSLVISFFIAIIVYIEKSLSNKYEAELLNYNDDLESKVNERTQLLLHAKQEAVEASLQKSQFVANTSHELRTPLQGIVGNIQLANRRLQQHVDNPSDQTADKIFLSLKKAAENSDRLNNLIERLLDLTRFEGGGIKVRASEFNFLQLIEKGIADLAPRAKERNLQLRLIKVGEAFNCKSDYTLVEQIISNLISNAIKYSLESEIVTVTIGSSDNEVTFKVENKSIPIPKDEMGKLFDPFYQSSVTDRRIGGTGLGLTLCQKFSDLIGGRVELLRSDEAGTAFTFAFPKFYTNGQSTDSHSDSSGQEAA